VSQDGQGEVMWPQTWLPSIAFCRAILQCNGTWPVFVSAGALLASAAACRR
jgi:hypothetical protein